MIVVVMLKLEFLCVIFCFNINGVESMTCSDVMGLLNRNRGLLWVLSC